MLLSRTRHLAKLRVKAFVFDKGNFQELLDVRRRHKLEDSMGFRGQWDEHRRFQITFLKERGLEPQHDFLEIGCGPLTGGIPLIEYLEPGKYVGVDIRSSVLNVSWGEIGLAGLSEKNPRLICSSSFGDEELGERQFDFVFSFSVLYHLSDDILRDYFKNVSLRLKPGGSCIAQVNTHLTSSTWLEFPFLQRKVADYVTMAGKAGLSATSLGSIDELGFRLPGDERLNEMMLFQKC
jgi:SAM-dependent methyltransferase